MRMLIATKEFRILGKSYPGLPILLDNAMVIVSPALTFLIYICIALGRAKSLGTWEQYGRAMYDFFGYCEANKLDWKYPGKEDGVTVVTAYRDWNAGENGLSSITINFRLSVIFRFYEFAVKKNWIPRLPEGLERVKLQNANTDLLKIDKTGGYFSDVFLSRPESEIRILTVEQIEKLLEALNNKTHKLIVRLGLRSGLRKEELFTFPVKYIVDPDENAANKQNYRVNLNPKEMRTKGGKGRGIDIPASLMRDLWDYVQHYRGERAILATTEGAKKILFLNQAGEPWAASGRGLNKILDELSVEFKVTPHMLRHTYATHTLYVLEFKPRKFNSLIYIRDRLGHKHVSTTEIYLHFLELIDNEILDEFQQELDEWFDNADTA
jgi:integrase/recombinase XerD